MGSSSTRSSKTRYQHAGVGLGCTLVSCMHCVRDFISLKKHEIISRIRHAKRVNHGFIYCYLVPFLTSGSTPYRGTVNYKGSGLQSDQRSSHSDVGFAFGSTVFHVRGGDDTQLMERIRPDFLTNPEPLFLEHNAGGKVGSRDGGKEARDLKRTRPGLPTRTSRTTPGLPTRANRTRPDLPTRASKHGKRKKQRQRKRTKKAHKVYCLRNSRAHANTPLQ